MWNITELTLFLNFISDITSYLIPKGDFPEKGRVNTVINQNQVQLTVLFKPIYFTIDLIINTSEILLVVAMVKVALHNSISRLILI